MEGYGQGTYTFVGGGEYSSEVIFERPYGEGTLTLADGTVKEGV